MFFQAGQNGCGTVTASWVAGGNDPWGSLPRDENSNSVDVETGTSPIDGRQMVGELLGGYDSNLVPEGLTSFSPVRASPINVIAGLI